MFAGSWHIPDSRIVHGATCKRANICNLGRVVFCQMNVIALQSHKATQRASTACTVMPWHQMAVKIFRKFLNCYQRMLAAACHQSQAHDTGRPSHTVASCCDWAAACHAHVLCLSHQRNQRRCMQSLQSISGVLAASMCAGSCMTC